MKYQACSSIIIPLLALTGVTALTACASDAMESTDVGSAEPVGVGQASMTGGGASLSLKIVEVGGQPVPSAAVTVQGVQEWTDAAGWVSFQDLEPGRVAAWVEADGFVSATTARWIDASGHADATMKLLPRGIPFSFDAGAGAVIDQGNVRVTIPPGVLVDEGGATVSGIVDATVVEIDPTALPEDAYPGPLVGRLAQGGDVGTLTSFGMTEVRVTQGGQEVQLAPDASVTLEITVPSTLSGQVQLGQSIPLWQLSPDGLWDEAGSGTVMVGSGGSPTWLAPLGFINNGANCDVFMRLPPANPK